MKKSQKNRYIKESLILLMLVLLGICMLAATFNEYGREYIETQDEHHRYVTEACSRNVEMLLEMHERELQSFSRRFGRAEAEWKMNQNGQYLEEALNNTIIARNPVAESLLCLEKGTIIVSTNGNMNYKIAEYGSEKKLVFCQDEKNQYYLLYLSDEHADIQYGVLMDLDQFYNRTVGEEIKGSKRSDMIVMADHDAGILFFMDDEELHIRDLTDKEEGEEETLWERYFRQCGEDEPVCSFWNAKKTEGKILRLITLPKSEKINVHISVGKIADYSHVTELLQEVVIKVVLYGTIVFVCVLVLIYSRTYLKMQQMEIRKELDYLKQKNILMTELTKRSNELAHYQRLQTIGTMTSGIVHDFNNILGVIDGYSMMLIEGLIDRDDKLAAYAIELHEASERAKKVTKQLSKLSGKHKDDERETVYLAKVVGEVDRVVKPIIPSNINMKITIEGEKIAIRGNSTQLMQMLLNLVINGFQAMESGGQLEIKLQYEHPYALIAVKDEGIGIPEEIKKQIFDPFFTTKEEGKGTGLGLALVKEIVELHKGQIRVESEPMKGTSFSILFPLNL